jgi:hypothetical protein
LLLGSEQGEYVRPELGLKIGGFRFGQLSGSGLRVVQQGIDPLGILAVECP